MQPCFFALCSPQYVLCLFLCSLLSPVCPLLVSLLFALPSMSSGWHQTVSTGQESGRKCFKASSNTYLSTVCMYCLHVCVWGWPCGAKVAEEVGELLIHCRFGCKASERPGTFEADPNGITVFTSVCVHVCV